MDTNYTMKTYEILSKENVITDEFCNFCCNKYINICKDNYDDFCDSIFDKYRHLIYINEYNDIICNNELKFEKLFISETSGMCIDDKFVCSKCNKNVCRDCITNFKGLINENDMTYVNDEYKGIQLDDGTIICPFCDEKDYNECKKNDISNNIIGNVLSSPVLATVQTCNEYGCWFIRTPRL